MSTLAEDVFGLQVSEEETCCNGSDAPDFVGMDQIRFHKQGATFEQQQETADIPNQGGQEIQDSRRCLQHSLEIWAISCSNQ